MKSNNRKIFIVLLLMVSILVTSGTFAYWATSVEGTSEEAVSTLTIGSAVGVETEFELSNDFNSGGLLVPAHQVINSNEGAVDTVYLSYNLAWNESNDISQLEGTTTIGQLSIAHRIKIYQDEELLPYAENKEVYGLINVLYNESNPTEMILNGDTELFQFSVTMDEPANQEQYHLISNATIKITLVYDIFENTIVTKDENGEIIDNPELPESDLSSNLVSRVVLNGDEVVYVEVGTEYLEPGFTAYDLNGDEVPEVWIEGGINTWKLGTQTLSYNAYSDPDEDFLTPVVRQIVIVDTTAPEIYLAGKDYITMNVGDSWLPTHGWALDNSNERVTVEISGVEDVDTETPGIYEIVYTSTDSSGNTATRIRTIEVQEK